MPPLLLYYNGPSLFLTSHVLCFRLWSKEDWHFLWTKLPKTGCVKTLWWELWFMIFNWKMMFLTVVLQLRLDHVVVLWIGTAFWPLWLMTPLQNPLNTTECALSSRLTRLFLSVPEREKVSYCSMCFSSATVDISDREHELNLLSWPMMEHVQFIKYNVPLTASIKPAMLKHMYICIKEQKVGSLQNANLSKRKEGWLISALQQANCSLGSNWVMTKKSEVDWNTKRELICECLHSLNKRVMDVHWNKELLWCFGTVLEFFSKGPGSF